MEFYIKYWKLIDEHHGELRYSLYGWYIFTLFFLRYVNCDFKKIYLELVEEGEGYEEDSDMYHWAEVFFVPPESRWEFIVENTFSEDILQIIHWAMKSVEYNNESLKKVAPKFKHDYRIKRDKIKSIIFLIDDEKTDNGRFWFNILEEIYSEMIKIEPSLNSDVFNEMIKSQKIQK